MGGSPFSRFDEDGDEQLGHLDPTPDLTRGLVKGILVVRRMDGCKWFRRVRVQWKP